MGQLSQFRENLGDGLVRVTLDWSRWYIQTEEDGTVVDYPSASWILSDGYPKGYGFQRYLAGLLSWEEGQRRLMETGERGSRVHAGIEQMLMGNAISIDGALPNRDDYLTGEDWRYLMSFKDWWQVYKPGAVLGVETTVISREHGYAGTLDLAAIYNSELGEEGSIYLVTDWKTSNAIYEEHCAQLAAYVMAARENGLRVDEARVVRLCSRHKVGYEDKDITEDLDYWFELFLAAKTIWAHHHGKTKRRYIDFPMSLSLESIMKEAKEDKNGTYIQEDAEAQGPE